MNLQCDVPSNFSAGEIIDGDRKRSVDRSPNAISHRKNFVAIPFARLHRLFATTSPVEFPASMFVIKTSPNIFSGISLIPDRLHVFSRQWPGAKLNARVSAIDRHPHVEREIEIAHLDIGPQEFVIGNVLTTMSGNNAILNRPEFHLPFPTGEVFSVEEVGFDFWLSRTEAGKGKDDPNIE